MDVTRAGMPYKVDCSPKALDELVKIVEKIDYDSTQIILGHPSDLLEMDMSKFSSYWYFISHHNLKQRELLIVKDGSLKETLYKFVKNNPDRVFRGEKDFKEE